MSQQVSLSLSPPPNVYNRIKSVRRRLPANVMNRRESSLAIPRWCTTQKGFPERERIMGSTDSNGIRNTLTTLFRSNCGLFYYLPFLPPSPPPPPPQFFLNRRLKTTKHAREPCHMCFAVYVHDVTNKVSMSGRSAHYVTSQPFSAF